MQAITPGPKLKVEFMKKIKKKLDQPTGKKGRPSLLKNKMCFEENWLATVRINVFPFETSCIDNKD